MLTSEIQIYPLDARQAVVGVDVLTRELVWSGSFSVRMPYEAIYNARALEDVILQDEISSAHDDPFKALGRELVAALDAQFQHTLR